MPTKKQNTKSANKAPQPKSTGKYLTSEMIRVDHGFAEYVRQQARASNVTVTEATRIILESLR